MDEWRHCSGPHVSGDDPRVPTLDKMSRTKEVAETCCFHYRHPVVVIKMLVHGDAQFKIYP